MSDSTKSRRHWFQFRLRSLLIVVAILSIPLAWIAKERRQSLHETRIAKRLQEEGFLQVGLSGPYDQIEKWEAEESQGWWRELAWQLLGDRIICASGAFTDFKDVTLLAELTNLQFLDLSDTGVSDIGPLANVRSLKYVMLSSTPLSNLAPFKKLTNLKSLSLWDTKVRDVSPLAHLQNLEDLLLLDTQVANLAPLAGLKKLEFINLQITAVTKDQIEMLQKALPNCDIQHDPFP